MDNELMALFPQNTETKQTTFMTTRELAETLNVPVRTINNTVNRLLESTFLKFGEIKEISQGGRPTKIFNAEQATAIKNEIAKHHNLKSRELENVETLQDMAQKIMEGQKAMERMNSLLMQRKTELEQENKAMKPLADAYKKFIDRDDCSNFRDAAAHLNVPQKEFMDYLRAHFIYKNESGEYRAYAPYDKKLFFLCAFEKGGHVRHQLKITPEGLMEFGKIFEGRRQSEKEEAER